MAAKNNANPNSSTLMASAEEKVPVVNVFPPSDGQVTMVLQIDDSPEMTVALNEDFSSMFSVFDSNGKEPMFKTFGSILGCNGGTLTINQRLYRIHVKQKQQQQQQDGKLRCCFRGIHCAGRTSI